ncbi:hypothetical protein GCM10028825_43230 [Spirosoma agri]
MIPSLAQTALPEQTYTYLIYHKLSPGLTIQDALPVEREWRAINQAAVDEGKLIGWYMMVKQMSSDPNAEYDYITVIVSPEMNMKGASPEAMKKIYGDSVQTRMTSLQNRDRATAPVVKMEIWKTMIASFGSGFAPEKSPLLLVDFMKPRDSSNKWMVFPPLMQFYREGMKRNELLGGGLSGLVVPNGSEKGYSMLSFQNVTSLNVIDDATSEVVKLRNQFNSSLDIVREEVLRAMEYTKRPAK